MANIDTRPTRPTTGSKARPLSPHLQVYRFIITMAASIMHRITGAGLYLGMFLLAWWLAAAAIGPEYFDAVSEMFGSILGRLILFGFTWALMHHMLGGLRHFIWDTGRGFDAKTREYLAWATFIGGGVLTLLVWIIGYAAR